MESDFARTRSCSGMLQAPPGGHERESSPFSIRR